LLDVGVSFDRGTPTNRVVLALALVVLSFVD